MNAGRIEQLGPPQELYERPATSFVAGFLGVSNLLAGTVEGPGAIRLDGGGLVRTAPNGRTGRVAAGVRPEKITIGAGGGENELTGTVTETAYIGVATHVVVAPRPACPGVRTERRRRRARARPGSDVTLTWSPEATFVVDQGDDGGGEG